MKRLITLIVLFAVMLGAVAQIQNLRLWNNGAYTIYPLSEVDSITFFGPSDYPNGVESGKTLWENISSNKDLSEFADLLQRVSNSNYQGTTPTETYADILNGSRTFTVWAPKNGSFDYAKYNALLNTGVAYDAYKVEQEIIRNSITRFNHIVTGKDNTILLLSSGKKVKFSSKDQTINNQHITLANLSSKNGVLHIIDGAIEYQPNIYEFLSTRDDISSINTFIKSFQKPMFNATPNTVEPSANEENTWVDSIFQTSNLYFSYLGTDLTREDSSYAMIIPTNDAWTEALEKVKPYFVYKTNYKQVVATVTPEGDRLTEGVETIFTEEELDSIVNFQVKNAISQNLVFNINAQHGYDHTQFGVEGACDSLVSTAGTVFYDPYSARLFNGAKPIEVSNGYAYIVDKFNFRPSDSWAKEKIIEAENEDYLEHANENAIQIKSTKSFSVEYDYNGVLKDTTIRYSALALSPKTSTSQPGATFILSDLLSCKYDIYVLVAYNNSDNKLNKFQVSLAYDEPTKRAANHRLKNPDEGDAEYYNTTYFSNKSPYVDENGEFRLVDSVLVAKDFEFPICYKGLTDAYATLTIVSNVRSSERNTYSREIHIDKIVLKAKE